MVKSMSGEVARSKSFGLSHSDDVLLYTKTTEKWSLVNKEASYVLEKRTKPVFFHAPTFQTNGSAFLREPEIMFVGQCTKSCEEIV